MSSGLWISLDEEEDGWSLATTYTGFLFGEGYYCPAVQDAKSVKHNVHGALVELLP